MLFKTGRRPVGRECMNYSISEDVQVYLHLTDRPSSNFSIKNEYLKREEEDEIESPLSLFLS